MAGVVDLHGFSLEAIRDRAKGVRALRLQLRKGVTDELALILGLLVSWSSNERVETMATPYRANSSWIFSASAAP
ncbi:hypothetical protein GCM10010339_21710 [Streptomyces alanosinicus]|uniref:Uncharacterized protein n=1 Tax=Streptomyces alanosinicus TaxID=68171 RepID=A0A919D0Q1_9ACTN|nr:hypothetical protein GCM10010339_21710 [Streptomyces alanosinicus]